MLVEDVYENEMLIFDFVSKEERSVCKRYKIDNTDTTDCFEEVLGKLL